MTKNTPTWRIAFLALGGACLIAGLNAGLLLAGVPAPVDVPELGTHHGLIMTLGFLGTVIALERAQALKKWWGYLAPGLLGLGGILLVISSLISSSIAATVISTVGGIVLAQGALAFTIVLFLLWRRSHQPLVAVQVLAAVFALIAAVMAIAVPITDLIPVLAAFIVLTIAAERAELAQLSMGPKAIPTLVTMSVLLSIGVVAHLVWPNWGARIYGAAQLILTLWLVRDDVARRFIKADGLRRYNAAALLAGYVWLGLAGIVWLIAGSAPASAAYDVVIHGTFLGFGMSMIMAHAPIIFPTVIGRPLPYRPIFYLPLAMLHVGMIARMAGDALGQGTIWQVGSTITVVSLIVFIPIVVYSVLRGKNPDESENNDRAGKRKNLALRVNVALAWFAALIVILITQRWVPESSWLMIHIVLLGALTHSAMVWSEHFAHTLLRTGMDESDQSSQKRRVIFLGLGTLLVLIGFPNNLWPVVLLGAVLVTVAILGHIWDLRVQLKKALPSRFRVVSHYYVIAAALLPIGIVFGVLMARHPAEPWYGRFLIAHLAINILGWIGLTVAGTLVTFWPTMIRSRMDPRAEKLAKRALPVMLVGIAGIVASALVDLMPGTFVGLAVYVTGLIIWGIALWAPVKTKGIREFAPASVGASLIWLIVGFIWIGVVLLRATTWADVTVALPEIGLVLAAGFGAQLLLGALTYLIPSVRGGGPVIVRAGQDALHNWSTFRIIVPNAALILWLVPTPQIVSNLALIIGIITAVTFLPLVAVAAGKSADARAAMPKRKPGELPPRTPRSERKPQKDHAWSVSGLLAAATVITLVAASGIMADTINAGDSTDVVASAKNTTDTVEPTGETTRVTVEVNGMRFTPDHVDVPAGNRLIVDFHNTGDDVHDLVIGDEQTPRLAPGATHELDAGVIQDSIQGYCSVAGHRAQGMVFEVNAIGAEGATTGGGHDHTTVADGMIPSHPDEELTDFIDPKLPKLPPQDGPQTHKHRLVMTEEALEVSPGQWQTRWTYNGKSVGPTLHGRVGDKFEITLVNDGTMGHSVDFHAGALAPDRPMRTIQPGEELTYNFTATRAGMWMYHCSTDPMSSHIAAGMHGAVVIEPDDLPEVDHQYVMVQTEVFLANDARTAEEAEELDGEKLLNGQPDRVVFNGIANQYEQKPLQVNEGERVRIWLLAAGPDRGLPFHIVGGQFDTTWTEGRYTLNRGNAPDGMGGETTDGGAQVLPLLPAQGGFVELTFPEEGHYSFVSHIMTDAERGAHGTVEVAKP